MAKKTSKPTTAAKQGKPKAAKPRKVVEKSSDDISATELIDARIKELGDWLLTVRTTRVFVRQRLARESVLCVLKLKHPLQGKQTSGQKTCSRVVSRFSV